MDGDSAAAHSPLGQGTVTAPLFSVVCSLRLPDASWSPSLCSFHIDALIASRGGRSLSDDPLVIAPHADLRFGPVTFRPLAHTGTHEAMLLLKNNLTMFQPGAPLWGLALFCCSLYSSQLGWRGRHGGGAPAGRGPRAHSAPHHLQRVAEPTSLPRARIQHWASAAAACGAHRCRGQGGRRAVSRAQETQRRLRAVRCCVRCGLT